jgi:hypothetical protein
MGMAIVTAAEVQTMLGIGNDNMGGLLDGLVSAACDMAEVYLNRWITKKEYTQVCDGGGSCLILKAYPVESVKEITLDAAVVPGGVLDADKGMLYPDGVTAWPYRPGGYRVTYTGGLEPVPAPIKQAVALLVAALKNSIENKGQQVASERLSDYSVTYARAADAAGLEVISVTAAALLRPYRSRPW